MRVAKAIRAHRERNLQLRLRFEEQNVALDEPRPIDFQFWAWTQRDAAVLARTLYEMGFLVRLITPASTTSDRDRWAVEAGARIPVAQTLGEELTESW